MGEYMASKNEAQQLKETFKFYLDHSDIVQMMNDADVNIDDRSVASTQTFEIWVEKPNGSKIYLRDFPQSDKIFFQYVRITDSDSTSTFSDIDVT